MTSTTTRMAAALILLAASATAQAFIYDETTDPDLSGDRLVPTLLSAVPGNNLLVLTSASGDRDYFTFAVPTGYLLSSIFHLSYSSNDNLSFFGLQSGSTLTEDPTSPNAANLLGYTHFGTGTANTEIIDELATSDSLPAPAQGFTAPLSAGNYTFWVQQTGESATYSFNFALTAVPEPQQWVLMLGGALMLALRMLRTRAS